MADMYGHGVVGSDGFLVPYLLVDFVNGEYLARIFHKQQQDVVFDGSQLNQLVIHGHFLVVIVNQQTAAFVYLVTALLVVSGRESCRCPRIWRTG